jgi:hypothetical protein
VECSGELSDIVEVFPINSNAIKEALVGFGRGLLLWLLGIPLPIIILLALFWHH